MGTREVGKFTFMLSVLGVTGLTAVSCGSPSSTFDNVKSSGAGLDGSTGIVPGTDASLIVGSDGAAGTPSCTPTTCAVAGYGCGPQGDGCGGQIDCGSCTPPQFCGGGGPSQCGGSDETATSADGGSVACTPKTCDELGFNCGPQGDGCGDLIPSCGTCSLPEFCGGGGPGVCGGSVFVAADGGTVDLCTPTTSCTSVGFACGEVDDGCGNLLPCGTCAAPATCGGGGIAGQCGSPCAGDGGLCQAQESCDGGTLTTITGTVEAGISAYLNPDAAAGKIPFPPDPVPNVLVYVPNSPLAAFAPGAACRQCSADVSGDPLVSTYTNFDGTFSLSGVPTPTDSATIPLVIQLGRWRREFTIATPTACSVSQVAPVGGTVGVLNLPRNSTEGNIPLTAVSTGSVDALECVLLKMGVDADEFTSNTAATPGRVHIYAGNPTEDGDAGTLATNGGAPGAKVANATTETTLMGLGGTYMNYDQILFPCWGGPAEKSSDELQHLASYAANGGHFFATHYSYSWLDTNAAFAGVAKWDLGTDGKDEDNPGTGPWILNVSTAVPIVSPPLHAGIFSEWLNYLCLLSNDPADCKVPNTTPFPDAGSPGPQVSIENPRFDVDSVDAGAVDWIDGKDQNDASTAFGKPLVEHFTFDTPVNSSSQCGHAIYSDFHVSNVSGAENSTFPAECTKNEFSAQEKILEFMLFDLASCVSPPTATCNPVTCADQGLQCGPSTDGCGNSIDCGNCPTGEMCGGGGTPGVCGAPDGGACVPTTCAAQNLDCGPAGNGCGGSIDGGCGGCPTGETCGGGGVLGQCGGGSQCTPTTCTALGYNCGPAGDGCGGLLECGQCTSPATCGGGGQAGVCGVSIPR